MKIAKITVSNYRNIHNISVCFHPMSNYIIGENNLGKSNLLSLLETICAGRSFDENDYCSPEEPIEAIIELKLLSNEIGFFGDNFSPEDETTLKIRYSQAISEAYPSIVSYDTGESIQAKQLKKIHFLKYDTNSIPSKELRLDTQKGAGLIVNSIIKRYMEDSGGDNNFLDDVKVAELTEFINEHLGKIRSFSDYSIKATIAEKPTEMLSRLFYLSDGQRKIDTTGSGVQFMAMASINILCQIMEIYKSKVTPFDEQVYIGDDGKKYLPLVLSIDEPEVHLHPFLQRSLIGYYKRILKNEDSDFKELVKMCFGIDGIDGQLIIVTHSTDALIDDYRNLIRFHKENGATNVISGISLRIPDTNEKHLIMHFSEIKEVFYSHCAIMIEGETEYGCIRAFAEKLGISLDDHEISIINARGQNSIKPLQRLLGAYRIPSVVVYDNDVKAGETPEDNEFFTNELCFEIEVVKHLCEKSRTDLVRQIVQEMDSNGEATILDFDFVKKPFKKLGLNTSTYVPKKLSDISEDNLTEFCNLYSTWYMVKKGVLLGRIIGDILPADLIPDCYADAIRKAQEVSSNA